jgi:aspartyl-tRNA(Asn)/glutamyl-tRNA(Gln) amidotransferase subunit A
MLGDDVLYATASELGQRLRLRQISPVELTESYLARIEALDPKLHAFVTPTPKLALEQARQAEKEIAAGKYRGPLHGLPYGVKDLLATKGIRTTWGAKPFEGQMFDFDATVIERLRAAGAILLGKLAMIELAGGLGYSIPGASLTGATLNPWSLDRWTCGSSSGSGAAVSAGLASFAIGSETWGSIVCPSSFCGVSGIRPTFGRISRYGAMALSWTLDKLGPMARSAEDLDTLLAVLSGHDPLDDWSASEPPHRPLPPARAKGLKAALVRPDYSKGGEAEVGVTFDNAVTALKSAGMAIEEVKLPDLPFEEVATVMLTVEAASAFEDLFRDGRVRGLVDRASALAAGNARLVTGVDYVKASRIRTLCQKAMRDFFEKWDVLLTPGEPVTAFPANMSYEEAEKEQWPDPVGGMGNLCGLPAVSVPCGFAKNLPVGLCIVGGAFEEGKVLGVAKYFQTLTDWHRRRPPLA